MSNNLNPDVCDDFSNVDFDFSTVPKLGSNLQGLGDDITAYLCNVLKVSRREDLDPVLRAGTEYNNDVWIAALTGLKNVGDPRFSMGDLMVAGLEKYLKPLEIQLKVLQEGCQVTNGVLCDAEGNEMPYYGKCDPPDLEMFSYENLTSFVVDSWTESLDKHADDFVYYLETNYLSKNWTIELFALGDDNIDNIKIGAAIPIFYVKLSKGTETPVYYKYYFDRRNYVANALEESVVIINLNEFKKNLMSNQDTDLVDVISGPYWPEKRKKDIFLSDVPAPFKPDRIYVDISSITQGGADTDVFITNDKWNNTLSKSISTGKKKITYPEDIHLTPVKFEGQFIPIRPYENGSFCIVFRDKNNWKRWLRSSKEKSPKYQVNIVYKADKNNYTKITKDIKIAKFERSYNGGSWSTESPVKMGYSRGYRNQTILSRNRVTCCVITNIWSLFV